MGFWDKINKDFKDHQDEMFCEEEPVEKARNQGSTPRPKGFRYSRNPLKMPVTIAGQVRRGKIVGHAKGEPEPAPKGGRDRYRKAIVYTHPETGREFDLDEEGIDRKRGTYTDPFSGREEEIDLSHLGRPPTPEKKVDVKKEEKRPATPQLPAMAGSTPLGLKNPVKGLAGAGKKPSVGSVYPKAGKGGETPSFPADKATLRIESRLGKKPKLTMDDVSAAKQKIQAGGSGVIKPSAKAEVPADGDRHVARWESGRGKHWVDLYGHSDGSYSYRAPSSGGNLGKLPSEEHAVKQMQDRVDSGLFGPDAAKKPMKRIK